MSGHHPFRRGRATSRRISRDVAKRSREELSRLGRQTRSTLILAAITGILTGLAVAGFEWVVISVFLDHVFALPIAAAMWMPLVGLLCSSVFLRWVGNKASAGTTDEYLQSFHESGHRISTRAGIAKVLASIATLGSGGPMGLEGPSIFMGSTIGNRLQRIFARYFRGTDHRMLLVAGAGAGVAAIFKTPATGAVYALEVPYQDDFARRMLLPTLVASATSYLTFVAFHGTAVLFPVDHALTLSPRDLIGALVLGVAAGLGARIFAAALRRAKRMTTSWAAPRRVVAAGIGLALLALASNQLLDAPLTLGAGYRTIAWAIDPTHAAWLAFALLVMRCAATVITVAGGGVGGLFIPLVVAGALLGRGVGGAIEPLDPTMFMVIGVAAFLGAGYRVPLAGVMFVAESTGRAAFIVPALLAAVAAELMMGRSSVTKYQLPLGAKSTPAGGEPDRTTGEPPPAAPPEPTADGPRTSRRTKGSGTSRRGEAAVGDPHSSGKGPPDHGEGQPSDRTP